MIVNKRQTLRKKRSSRILAGKMFQKKKKIKKKMAEIYFLIFGFFFLDFFPFLFFSINPSKTHPFFLLLHLSIHPSVLNSLVFLSIQFNLISIHQSIIEGKKKNLIIVILKYIFFCLAGRKEKKGSYKRKKEKKSLFCCFVVQKDFSDFKIKVIKVEIKLFLFVFL